MPVEISPSLCLSVLLRPSKDETYNHPEGAGETRDSAKLEKMNLMPIEFFPFPLAVCPHT